MMDDSSIPMVSVIVPTFNRPAMLAEALKSIINQTYANYEIIVVNDGGEDVIDIINKLTCAKITYVTHNKNKGMAAARNTGIKAAHGKYIAYLDDDDIYYPDHLMTLVNLLENSEYKVAYTSTLTCFQEIKDNIYVTINKELAYNYDFDPDRLLYYNFIPIMSSMHEKLCINQVGMFDVSFKMSEDWDFWIRLSRKYKFYHINKVTCEYRKRNDNSNMSFNRKNIEKARIHIYRKYRKYAIGKTKVLEEQYYRKKRAKKRIREIRYYYLYYLARIIKKVIIKLIN